MISVSFKGIKTLQNRLNKTSVELANIEQILQKEARVVTSGIKRKAPIKTGRLSRSITMKNVSRGNDKGFRVYSNVKYAPYQDFGTGELFNNRPFNYREFDDYASNFKGTQKANPETPPRAYFMSNFILGRRNLNREYKRILNNLRRSR